MFRGHEDDVSDNGLGRAYNYIPGKASGMDDVSQSPDRSQSTSISASSSAPLRIGCEIEAIFCPKDVEYYKIRRARVLARDIAINHNSRITNSRDLQMESYMSITEQHEPKSEVEGDWADYSRWSIVPEPAIRRPRHRTNEKCRIPWLRSSFV